MFILGKDPEQDPDPYADPDPNQNKKFLNFILRIQIQILKGSVQRDKWGSDIMLVQFLLVWDSRDPD